MIVLGVENLERGVEQKHSTTALAGLGRFSRYSSLGFEFEFGKRKAKTEESLGKEKGKTKDKKRKGKREKLQHPDFARGHPPHYYLGQNVLNFADRTGCGALTIVWP